MKSLLILSLVVLGLGSFGCGISRREAYRISAKAQVASLTEVQKELDVLNNGLHDDECFRGNFMLRKIRIKIAQAIEFWQGESK